MKKRRSLNFRLAIALAAGVGVVVFSLRLASTGQIRPSYCLIIVCLTLSIAFVALAESFAPRLGEKDKRGAILVGLALLFCWGTCVGVMACTLNYFFDVREWVSIALGVPLGVLLLFVIAWFEG